MGGEPALVVVYLRRGGLASGLRHPSASPLCGWLACVPCHAAPEAVMRARAKAHEGLGGCMGGEPALNGVYHRQGGLAGRLSHLSASPLCGWLSCEPGHAAPVALTHTLARNGAWGLFRAPLWEVAKRGGVQKRTNTQKHRRGGSFTKASSPHPRRMPRPPPLRFSASSGRLAKPPKRAKTSE